MLERISVASLRCVQRL